MIADSLASREQVIADGWQCLYLTDGADIVAEMKALAQSLGRPMLGRKGKMVEKLAPKTQESAEPKSLSAIHGRDPFPLHTDGAHLPRPPRFVILACLAQGSVPVPT